MTLLNFYELRKQYELPAAKARAILDKLGFRVENIDGELMVDTQLSILPAKHNVDAEYLIKHAVAEYKKTRDIKLTLEGKFLEFDVEGDNVKGRVGISTMNVNDLTPITPSLQRKPNAQPTGLVKAVKATPPAPAAPPNDAINALAAALVEAQRAAAPPDPLLPQKQLLEAEQHGFHITSEQLGQLLGMTRSTISSKKSGFIKLGFRFEKVKEGTTTLWKVVRD